MINLPNEVVSYVQVPNGWQVNIGTKAGTCVRAPDVAVIGTIPYISSRLLLPWDYGMSQYETGVGIIGPIAAWRITGGGAFKRLFETGCDLPFLRQRDRVIEAQDKRALIDVVRLLLKSVTQIKPAQWPGKILAVVQFFLGVDRR